VSDFVRWHLIAVSRLHEKKSAQFNVTMTPYQACIRNYVAVPTFIKWHIPRTGQYRAVVRLAEGDYVLRKTMSWPSGSDTSLAALPCTAPKACCYRYNGIMQ
jgi:hypothetical protein